MPDPRSNTVIFVWERDESLPDFWLRRRLAKNEWEAEWQDRNGQRRYDAFRDEWDICSEFGPDDERWDDPYQEVFQPMDDDEPAPQGSANIVPSIPAPAVAAHAQTPGPSSASSASSPPLSALSTPVPSTTPPHPHVGTPAQVVPAAPVVPAASAANALTQILAPVTAFHSIMWVSPNTVEDTLRFHYGNTGQPLPETVEPFQEPLRVLGWTLAEGASLGALVQTAKRLNSSRVLTSADLALVGDHTGQTRVYRRTYHSQVWDPVHFGKGDCYVVRNLRGSTYPWMLTIHDPAVVVHILRRWRDLPTHMIVFHLSTLGIPFTLFRDRGDFHMAVGSVNHHQFIHRRKVCHGWVPETGLPSLPHFQRYIADLRDFFTEPYRLRAAIQYGGIVWRIACEFVVDNETVDRAQAEHLAGPDDYSLHHGGVPQRWTTGQEVWQEALSSHELLFICGVYLDDTGRK